MFANIKSACDRTLNMLRTVEWVGPLMVRLVLGVVFATTGWGKLHNLDTVGGFFDSLGIPAPHATAMLVSTIELVGGVMLLVGLGTRVAALLLAGIMVVAIWTAKLPDLHGVVDLAGTIELAYLASFVWLVVHGGGAASLDRLLGRSISRGTEPVTALDAGRAIA